MNQNWVKSSYCNNTTACVEVRAAGAGAAVRDSKDTGRTPFTVGRVAWQTFVSGVQPVQ
jgi:Domain of unknown function (DUF397)